MGITVAWLVGGWAGIGAFLMGVNSIGKYFTAFTRLTTLFRAGMKKNSPQLFCALLAF
jgi:hypothetical protein